MLIYTSLSRQEIETNSQWQHRSVHVGTHMLVVESRDAPSTSRYSSSASNLHSIGVARESFAIEFFIVVESRTMFYRAPVIFLPSLSFPLPRQSFMEFLQWSSSSTPGPLGKEGRRRTECAEAHRSLTINHTQFACPSNEKGIATLNYSLRLFLSPFLSLIYSNFRHCSDFLPRNIALSFRDYRRWNALIRLGFLETTAHARSI